MLSLPVLPLPNPNTPPDRLVRDCHHCNNGYCRTIDRHESPRVTFLESSAQALLLWIPTVASQCFQVDFALALCCPKPTISIEQKTHTRMLLACYFAASLRSNYRFRIQIAAVALYALTPKRSQGFANSLASKIPGPGLPGGL